MKIKLNFLPSPLPILLFSLPVFLFSSFFFFRLLPLIYFLCLPCTPAKNTQTSLCDRPKLKPCPTRECGTWEASNFTKALRSGSGPLPALLHRGRCERMLSGNLKGGILLSTYPDLPFIQILSDSFRFYLIHSDFFLKFSELQIVLLKIQICFGFEFGEGILVLKFRCFSVYSDFFSHSFRFCVGSKWQVCISK